MEVIQTNKMFLRGAGGWNVHQANHWSMLGPIPLSPFIKDLDDRTGFTLHKSAKDAKLGGGVNRPGGCSAIQRELIWWERWTNGNLTNFRNGERPSPAPRKKKPKYQHRLEADQLESRLAESLGCPCRYQADGEPSMRPWNKAGPGLQ